MFALLPQKMSHLERLFVGDGKDRRRSSSFYLKCRTLMHRTLILADSNDGHLLHAIRNLQNKAVGIIRYGLVGAIVVGEFVKCCLIIRNERFQVSGITSTESIDVLVIVAHGNNSHFLVLLH